MRIGFDAKRVFSNRTGLGNYSRTLLDNLRLYSPDNDYILFTPKIFDNEFGRHYATKFTTYTPEKLGGTLWRSYGISESVQNSGVEVFHGLSNELPFRLKNVKKIVTVHDLIFKALPNTYSFFDRQVYDLKSRKSCQKADTVIAISESTKAAIIHYYGIPAEKIKILYQACHSIYYQNTASVDVRTKFNLPTDFILSVGSVIERKNLLNVIKAYDLLSSDLQIPLLVVGRGKEYKSKIMAFLRKKGLLKNVIWLENVETVEDLKGIYEAANFTIYPSLHEGFGLPVAESLLCKTPVITSNISSLPEAGGPDTLQVDPTNIEEMKQAMERILTDYGYANASMEKGHAYVRKQFDPHKLTQQLIDIYLG